MARFARSVCVRPVALRKESVDRNHASKYRRILRRVALRKESVDRNHVRDTTSTRPSVALRKESVDRNLSCNYPLELFEWVALRKESVDRNRDVFFCHEVQAKSLSARRAWIEIRDTARD